MPDASLRGSMGDLDATPKLQFVPLGVALQIEERGTTSYLVNIGEIGTQAGEKTQGFEVD